MHHHAILCDKAFGEEKDCNLKTTGEKYVANVAEFGQVTALTKTGLY